MTIIIIIIVITLSRRRSPLIFCHLQVFFIHLQRHLGDQQAAVSLSKDSALILMSILAPLIVAASSSSFSSCVSAEMEMTMLVGVYLDLLELSDKQMQGRAKWSVALCPESILILKAACRCSSSSSSSSSQCARRAQAAVARLFPHAPKGRLVRTTTFEAIESFLTIRGVEDGSLDQEESHRLCRCLVEVVLDKLWKLREEEDDDDDDDHSPCVQGLACLESIIRSERCRRVLVDLDMWPRAVAVIVSFAKRFLERWRSADGLLALFTIIDSIVSCARQRALGGNEKERAFDEWRLDEARLCAQSDFNTSCRIETIHSLFQKGVELYIDANMQKAFIPFPSQPQPLHEDSGLAVKLAAAFSKLAIVSISLRIHRHILYTYIHTSFPLSRRVQAPLHLLRLRDCIRRSQRSQRPLGVGVGALAAPDRAFQAGKKLLSDAGHGCWPASGARQGECSIEGNIVMRRHHRQGAMLEGFGTARDQVCRKQQEQGKGKRKKGFVILHVFPRDSQRGSVPSNGPARD